MRLIFTLILILFFATAQAQLQSYSTSPLTAYGAGANMRVIDMPPAPQGLDHSLYLEEEWLPGSIALENGRVIKSCTLRYDIVNGFIEVQNDIGVRAAPVKDVAQFSMNQNGRIRWFVNIAEFVGTKENDHTLMEVLVDKDVKLFRATKIEVVKSNDGITSQRRDLLADPITSMRKDTYYINQGEELVDVSSKPKLLKAFGDQEQVMKSWAKKNKLGFKKENDLIKLIGHYADL